MKDPRESQFRRLTDGLTSVIFVFAAAFVARMIMEIIHILKGE